MEGQFTDIYEIRRKRFETVVKESKLSQAAFAKKLGGRQQQQIWKLLEGKNKVSRDIINQVKLAFPEYNIGWLEGLSNYKLQAEYDTSFERLNKQVHEESELLESAFNGLLELGGYRLVTEPIETDGTIEILLGAIKSNMYITDGTEETERFGVVELNAMQNELYDFAMYLVYKHMPKTK
jgi:plasmid maintenance system antidote protein VapI